MKKIALFTLGGTISAKGKDRNDLKDYRSGLLDGSDFLSALPELNDLADIEVIPVDNISSTQINESHWIQLKNQIDHYLNKLEYQGVVITHGTNTMEETAYFLHLTVNSDKPVVLVGAQRPFTALSSDAHLNLINAFRVAVALESHGKGVLVAVNDEIHSAREVTKTHTYHLDAFQSGEFGVLGFIDPDKTVQYYRKPTRSHTVNSAFTSLSTEDAFPLIEIIYSYAGATGKLIEYIVQDGTYQGIIMAGTGAGRFSKKEEKALHKAREQGLIIVRSSRVGNGRVLDIEPYKDLDAISGDNLTPQKARILLSLSLATKKSVNEIRNIFTTY